MASSLKLPCSLLQFLADADRVAAMLDRDGDRLAAVTGGRVHRGMAEEIRQLVAEVRRIEAERERPRVGLAEPLKREARALVARVSAAARWAGEGNPVLMARFEKLRKECPVRSVSVVALASALSVWAALVREHARELDPLRSGAAERMETIAQNLVQLRETRARQAATGTSLVAARNVAIERVRCALGQVHCARALVVPVRARASVFSRC